MNHNFQIRHKFSVNFIVFIALTITGCKSQGIFVYEKLPEVSECRRHKNYISVRKCNREHQVILSEKLNKAINITERRLSRKFNQGKRRCKENAYRIAPAGCYVNHLPILTNLPTVGKTKD